jgi:hypothetical protein
MWSILDKKNTDITKEFGNGEKDGEAEPWHSKDQEELEEPLMVIAIDFTLLLCMQTLWKSILYPKFLSYL